MLYAELAELGSGREHRSERAFWSPDPRARAQQSTGGSVVDAASVGADGYCLARLNQAIRALMGPL
eukprot:6704308-Pyramimonas_sp.AAC.1